MRVTSAVVALLVGFTSSATAQNNWVQNNPDIYFTGGKVGIGTGSPAHPLSVQTGDGPAVGIYVLNSTTSGSFATGLWSESSQGTARGIQGRATATSGDNIGVYGMSASTTGHGLYGLAQAETGIAFGIRGISASHEGFGIRGIANSTADDATGVGVHGRSSGEFGMGVYGEALHTTGTNYGVYGYSASGTNGYAVFANGTLAASGSKSFVIDHPSDPENKVLVHFSSEGPEPFLIYRGTIELDASGAATVSLPAYFHDIARDPQYQLTAVGAPAPSLHIAAKVNQGQFVIGGGPAGIEVCWTVTAVRNDLWMQTHPQSVERNKPESERGTYLHPELYGQPETKRTRYIPPDESLPPQD